MDNYTAILLKEAKSLKEKISILKEPLIFVAESIQDYKETIGKVKYPFYSRLITDSYTRNYVFIQLHGAFVKLKEKNDFVYDVKLWDLKDSIDTYWVDGQSLIKDIRSAQRPIKEIIRTRREIYNQSILNNELNEKLKEYEDRFLEGTPILRTYAESGPKDYIASYNIRTNDFVDDIVMVHFLKQNKMTIGHMEKSNPPNEDRTNIIVPKGVGSLDLVLV